MWINPKYAARAAPEPAVPPQPTGQLLAAFPRKGPDGLQQELRIVLDSYLGRPYLSVRLWQADRSGAAWWPIKGKGVSIRISEVDGAIQALEDAMALAAQAEADAPRPTSGSRPPQRTTRPPTQQRQQQERPPWRSQERPTGGDQSFDEFNG